MKYPILALALFLLASVPLRADGMIAPPDALLGAWQWAGTTTPGDEIAPDAPERYTVEFGADWRVAVGADCNRGAGGYDVIGERELRIPSLAVTRAMCAPGSLSDRFLADLSSATTFFFRDGELHLDLPQGAGTLRFTRP